MDVFETVLRTIGVSMCILALLPLAFWTIQSWATLKHNQRQYRGSQELLRQKILAASNQRSTDFSHPPVSDSLSVAEHPDAPPSVNSVPAELVSNVAAVESVDASQDTPNIVSDGTWRGFRRFRVDKLREETANCTSVYLIPEDGKAIASFKAGQHLPLRFHLPNQPKPVVRCYSLSDGPGENHYRISVKAMPARDGGHAPGVISNFVNHQLQEGDLIESKAPAGSFHLDLNDSRPVVLLAGGIGITPMLSMIESLQANAPDRLMVLFYGVVNKSEHAFADKLRQLIKANESFHIVNCFSQPQADEVQGTDYHVQGRVTVDLIKQLLPDPNCQFYLCGPPPFMQSLTAGLRTWGVPETQLHSEAFGPASINKSVSNASNTPAGSVGVEAADVTFDQAGKTIAWNPDHDSLLELAESHGIDLDFGCRAGSCGTCAMTLVAGEVEYPDGIHAKCEPGQCLTCVARPVGSVKLGAAE